MKTASSLIALSLAAIVAGPASAATDPSARGEAELAKILEGRVAGAPVDCIDDYAQQGMQTIDGVGFIFRRGKVIYVNRPGAAAFVHDSDLPVFEKHSGSRLCRLDRVEMRDRITLMHGPVTFLGDFIPYRLTDRGDRP